MKIAFFKLEQWEKEYITSKQKMNEADLEKVFFDQALDVDHVPTETNFEGISIFVDSRIGQAVLDKFPNLKFITTRSTGYDHIDIGECRKRGIVVSYVPAYGENTVAEYAFALLLALSRKIFDGYARLRETGSFNYNGLRGFDLKGKTLGVVGTGRIGRHVVKIAKGFDMEVVASDVHPDNNFARELGFSYIELEDLLAKSDIVTLHVPYMKATHHLINGGNIFNMKKGAYLINTSRGAVVDTSALVEALEQGHIAGAGLDVLEEEGAIKDELNFLVEGHPEEHSLKTILANHALIDHPNVIVTPHNAFNTGEALKRILDTTIENILGFINGKPKNLVK
jgi:D-lactate dehydrogenase